MAIRIVKDRISRTELKALLDEDAAGLKVVADLDKALLGIGGLMHHDIEALLISDGSKRKDLWGFSLFLDKPWQEAFEFRSNVNVRPQDGNVSIQIRDEKICQALLALAAERVDWNN